ncbi:UNVERIFIED_CONTAM: hypothetical protein Scaly_2501500 [Sesamum calycinum]|uniref:Uncharacterized protein n=1 Tax=Sesamum calycinum TaxID=2727403 RepID=A0AAW2LSB6_9LAMI
MLYWKDDVDLEYCKFCGDARYKPSRGRDPHRKKSPYAVLEESHNVRLDLYTYGFVPHGQYDHTYLCWPVIITPYNLPPSMCMSSEYMFSTIVIPSPSNSKRLIDVYFEPLIEELLQLWHVGVRTYDHAIDRDFIVRAALMWTVNDLPTFGMAFGWSIAGVMGCPKLIPIAFREILPEHVWSALTEVHQERNYADKDLLKCHYWGPGAEVTLVPANFVNGYNFQTERHNTGKSTMNCGVCVKSSSYTDEEHEFYGIIKEIIQLTYPLIPNLPIMLFKCHWVDPIRGMKVHPSYHLVDVNFKKLY